ncbi:hypothetical protein GCM10011492_01890 [Flexivirga endophytica]|uniref:Uncharacterized protein n=1 Tax=Flexivirga endophytica TaxID=1849103 RepID=A0A916SVH0_9MICO|nr:hypothetical protein [Flexivirga endophytica]GGB15807.1 hypothetical protein GCM10011492_01890 [Flexivirga endophytica]GHB39793.1 hypothetical protein GCM10008112_05730 [Flexivirga endophytica]
MTDTPNSSSSKTRINSGPGRMLVAVYGLLGLAATGRSILQIAQTWPDQHLPYWLSAVAAVVYLVATVALARASARVALGTITFELFGVLAVGIWSYVDKAAFVAQGSAGDTTVWSKFGQGYGYVPLILPILGLWWLRRNESR